MKLHSRPDYVTIPSGVTLILIELNTKLVDLVCMYDLDKSHVNDFFVREYVKRILSFQQQLIHDCFQRQNFDLPRPPYFYIS